MKLVSLVALFVSGGIASACLWDRDTITDELQTRATQYDLVMGQFPSHGEAYYLKRIEKLEASAGKTPLLWNESNDLAVAYIRTKQFSKALLILKKIMRRRRRIITRFQTLVCYIKNRGTMLMLLTT